MLQRDLLLLMGFLRSGTLFPSAVPFRNVPAHRSLKTVHAAMLEQERALFGPPATAPDDDDLRRRAAIASWYGDALPLGSRVEEVPDPGVLLCLLYDAPIAGAPLPAEVLAQTLRRFALREATLRKRFDEHVDRAGTFVPKWLSPETRRQRSQEQFDAAMKVARESGFAHAASLFEGVRGDSYPAAQVAIAVYELRDLGQPASALRRLDEVARVAPRHVAARMQRAKLLMADSSRRVEAATDFLVVLREIARPESQEASRELRDEASEGLWALNRAFANTKKLDAAVALSKQDPERGFEALSRYIHTHPCAWDAQTQLATLALLLQRFDVTIKLLGHVRWLFPEDPNPHFVYGQALASAGEYDAAKRALEYAVKLSPKDPELRQWLSFAQTRAAPGAGGVSAAGVKLAAHVARTLLVVLGIVRGGHVHPFALVLHKLPGEVSLAFVLQAIAAHESRRFGDSGPKAASRDTDGARGVGRRAVLTDYAGDGLDPRLTIGDVADPGVLVALLYERVVSEAPSSSSSSIPPAAACRAALLSAVSADVELAGKLERHLHSPEATLKSRLDL